MDEVYVNGDNVAIYISEEEFEIVKSLVERWVTELESSVQAIDEMPQVMREYGYAELDTAISKAEELKRKLDLVE